MYRGDTGKVRIAIDSTDATKKGFDPFIFNDKRKTFRRIKVWHRPELADNYNFLKNIIEQFGDRVIKISKTERQGRYAGSTLIYLKY